MGRSQWLEDQQGDFSCNKNDTFDPNKKYVGIRLTNGRSPLDRDWNELEDIRRYEEMLLRKWYIGNGTPDDGFRISQVDNPASNPNNFKILKGRCLVDGFEVENESEMLYSTQQGLPALAPPQEGKRSDIAYIDAWVTEILNPVFENCEDKIVNCIRHKIEWRVKVRDENEEFIKDGFHHYYDIAKIEREAGKNEILDSDIKDLRRTELAVHLLKHTMATLRDSLIVLQDSQAKLKDALTNKADALHSHSSFGNIDISNSQEIAFHPNNILHPSNGEIIGSESFSIRCSDEHPNAGHLRPGEVRLQIIRNEPIFINDPPLPHFGSNRYEVLSISKKDNVGISTSNPQAKLHVNGDVIIEGNCNRCSDRRFKANVMPLSNVLDKIGMIRGVSFEWDRSHRSSGSSTGRREIGLIAQEVEAIFPELVATWGEGDYKGIDYDRLTGVLVEAIKELKAENQAANRRIEKLEEAFSKLD